MSTTTKITLGTLEIEHRVTDQGETAVILGVRRQSDPAIQTQREIDTQSADNNMDPTNPREETKTALWAAVGGLATFIGPVDFDELAEGIMVELSAGNARSVAACLTGLLSRHDRMDADLGAFDALRPPDGAVDTVYACVSNLSRPLAIIGWAYYVRKRNELWVYMSPNRAAHVAQELITCAEVAQLNGLADD